MKQKLLRAIHRSVTALEKGLTHIIEQKEKVISALHWLSLLTIGNAVLKALEYSEPTFSMLNVLINVAVATNCFLLRKIIELSRGQFEGDRKSEVTKKTAVYRTGLNNKSKPKEQESSEKTSEKLQK